LELACCVVGRSDKGRRDGEGALGVLLSLLVFTAHGASFADIPNQVYTIVADLFASVSSTITLIGWSESSFIRVLKQED